MARNEEKALTLFNKWETFKKDFHSSASNRRPLLASDCESLPEAEKWRRDLIRDITKKISVIQNGSLGEHRIREINDEINKMMRQKHFWETRIRELGGDVQKGRQFYDIDGKELPGAPGYKYYGAAKELPGVRELFSEREDELKQRRLKRSRADMYKNITPDYYGYRDDDDGLLATKEAAREAKLLAKAEAEAAQRKQLLLQKVKELRGTQTQQRGNTSSSSTSNNNSSKSSSAHSGGGGGSDGTGALTQEEIALLEDSDDDGAEAEEERLRSLHPVGSSSCVTAGTSENSDSATQQDTRGLSRNSLTGAAESAITTTSTSDVIAAPIPAQSASTDASLKSHVALPAQEDINALLLAEKRRALLQRISSL